MARQRAFLALKSLVKSLHALRPKSGRVVYCPPFSSIDDLTSHYHRARWYLPAIPGKCQAVGFLHTLDGGSMAPDAPPAHMGLTSEPSAHLRIRPAGPLTAFALLSADAVVFWRKPYPRLAKTLERALGIGTAYVATDDPNAMEFGHYCGFIWDQLTTPAEQRAILDENRARFLRVAEKLRASRPSASCVFGTGPSIDHALEFDFSETLCVVCNSIVQSDKLLDHIRPRFICAGDVVSHFGVSAYARKFREQLVRALETRDLYLLTTAKYGSLFLHHHPGLRDRVFLIEQAVDGPVYDLTQRFAAPRLASTLNIHMLPLASTFSNRIFILGCDGKDPAGNNEDFWAHSPDAQYHDLVDTGHKCHPTFAQLRQVDTYERYIDSLERTIAGGEARGLRYFSLRDSFIDALHKRVVPEDMRRIAEWAARPIA